MKNILASSHPGSKIIFAFFIMLVSFLATLLIAFIVAIPVFHIDIMNISDAIFDYSDPNNLNFLKYLQTIQAIGLFIVPAILIAYLFSQKTSDYLKFDIQISSTLWILCVFITISIIPIINSLAILNESMSLPNWMAGLEKWMQESENSAAEATRAFLQMNSVYALIFNLFMIAVLPAIGEELIFRGIFQRLFAEWTKNIHFGIIIAAIFFSALHMQFYGFLPRFALGLLFGYLFYWSGSIWIPILAHFINNATAVIVYYYYADDIIENVESFGASSGSYGFLAVSIFIVGSALFLFYKEARTLKS